VWWLICILALFGLANQSRGNDDWLNHVTFNVEKPQGSCLIKYGGIEGLVRDEVKRQLFNLWIDYNKTLYQQEVIDFDRYRVLNERVLMSALNADVVGLWWQRRWFESIGPPTPPEIFLVGNHEDVMDLGFVKVNSQFKVKLEEFEVDLYSRKPEHRWEMKVRPSLSVGSRNFFSYAEMRLAWIYRCREKKWVDIQIAAGYRQRDGFYGGLEVVLPSW
jgi:hypothetical protein